MEKKEKENFNLNKFLESEEYVVLNHNLNKEINHNSIYANTKINKFSNLLVSSIPTFKKTNYEKSLSKKLKSQYVKFQNTLHNDTEKNEFLKTFLKYHNSKNCLCISKFILT